MRFIPHAKQEEFINAVLSGEFNYLLYGGGIRGGKSYVVFLVVCLLAKVYPGSRWAIVRKDLPTIRRNVIPKFEEIRPTNFVNELNQSKWSYSCANGSEILLFPENFTQDKELNRWKGLEVNGFAPDEMNELNQATFLKMIERAGSWIARGGKQPNPLILGTCNPANGWVKTMFYDKHQNRSLSAPYYYQPATIFDNPHIPESYLKNLQQLKEANPSHFERFVLGRWDVADEPDQLIQYEWIKNALESVEEIDGPQSLGVDVARFGDDKTAIAHTKGNTLIGIDTFEGLSTERVAAHVRAKMQNYRINADNIGIDTVGVGGGVYDNLKASGFNILSIESGSKAVNDLYSEYKFRNLRSQMWFNLREMLRKGEISFRELPTGLQEDLISVKYKISADKLIEVESKDSIKKRLGRSTDYGDAVVYAFFIEKLSKISSISIGGSIITF